MCGNINKYKIRCRFTKNKWKDAIIRIRIRNDEKSNTISNAYSEHNGE